MSGELRVGWMSGVGHPVGRMRALLRKKRDPGDLGAVLDQAEAVDALALLLTEAIEARQTKDGRIDMRDVAAHVLAQMQRSRL